MKKVVIIYENDRPIKCCEIREVEKEEDLMRIKAECEKNQELRKAKEEETKRLMNELTDRLIKIEAELNFDKGIITKQEYHKICGIIEKEEE